jgi:hypothetical protein
MLRAGCGISLLHTALYMDFTMRFYLGCDCRLLTFPYHHFSVSCSHSRLLRHTFGGLVFKTICFERQDKRRMGIKGYSVC